MGQIIAPRADGEGSLGTATLHWGDVRTDKINGKTTAEFVAAETPKAHALDAHTAVTLAELSAKVSDKNIASTDAATTSAAGLMSVADKTKLDGVEAGAYFKRSNILGEVGFSDSVPNGAIIESGRNSNGEWMKLANGLCVFWMSKFVFGNSTTSHSVSFTLPVAVSVSGSDIWGSGSDGRRRTKTAISAFGSVDIYLYENTLIPNTSYFTIKGVSSQTGYDPPQSVTVSFTSDASISTAREFVVRVFAVYRWRWDI